jgi:hypothetical protein
LSVEYVPNRIIEDRPCRKSVAEIPEYKALNPPLFARVLIALSELVELVEKGGVGIIVE